MSKLVESNQAVRSRTAIMFLGLCVATFVLESGFIAQAQDLMSLTGPFASVPACLLVGQMRTIDL
jgi:hypothetical protein